MDLYSLVSEYINPFECPSKVFNDKVLTNIWICCSYWSAHDWLLQHVERQCGEDSITTIDSSLELMFPHMRERCPGNVYGYSCKFMLNFLMFCFIVVFLILSLWTLAITVIWLRLRKKLSIQHHQQRQLNDHEHCSYNIGFIFKLLPRFSKIFRKIELQPLTKSISNNSNISTTSDSIIISATTNNINNGNNK